MTRIIAGAAGSLGLSVPRSGTRPTSDRVREALFSGLEARGLVAGAHVLDLYAGSGALGLEAGSRGAASVTLVERAPRAAAVCRANGRALEGALAHARVPVPRIRVHAGAAAAFLAGAGHDGAGNGGAGKDGAGQEGAGKDGAGKDGAGRQWDLVFIDPPYDLPAAELDALLVALVPLLAADATVVVERSVRSGEPGWPDGLAPERRTAYGETVLWWAAPPADPGSAERPR